MPRQGLFIPAAPGGEGSGWSIDAPKVTVGLSLPEVAQMSPNTAPDLAADGCRVLGHLPTATLIGGLSHGNNALMDGRC